MELELVRDDSAMGRHNFGQLFADGQLLGETLEDPDRALEIGGKKIHGETAIPRGRYKVALSFSERFQRLMPLICDVPGFVGVRIHGGNTEANTEGCPLLGSVRTKTGIKDCAAPNTRLMSLLRAAMVRGEAVWLTVR